jgi:outer membrane biosynthesis protein TonB
MATEQPHLADGSVDPNVRVPDHVKAASSAADKIHEQFYPKDPAQAAAPNKEAIPQPDQPQPDQPQPQPQPQPEPQPQPQPQPQPEPRQAGDPADNDESWRHKFLSMQGRYNSAAKQIGSMEHQMVELGQELVRTQSLLQAANQGPPLGQNNQPVHNNLITDEDRANYGDDLINLTQRAARAAISPELEALRAENQNLKKTVNTSVKSALFDQVTQAIPDWRQINKTPQWLTWLTLPNLYTGQVRQQMLNAAIAGAEAPKVIQLFRDFLSEINATGQTLQPAQQEQQLAPRAAAVPLESLAAPGRARPASGETPQSADKPIYSRAQISKFYDDVRRQLYAGREAEYRAFEADITAAQREGRIR